MTNNRTTKIFKYIQNRFNSWFSELFIDESVERQSFIIRRVWITLLYVVGIVFWAVFFNWDKTPLNYHDWQTINMPRLDVMHDAFQYGMLPLHVSCGPCLHKLLNFEI